MSKGLFITFEGCDGSGKSTQISLIIDKLVADGVDFLLTREPGGTKISEKIREIILDINNFEMNPYTEMYLYAAARAQLTADVIIPALNAGKTVICDRYLDSSIVYQGVGRELGSAVEDVNTHAVMGIEPDLTILLSIDPREAISRATTKGADRMEAEDIEYHLKVYEAYKKLAERFPNRIKDFDASGTIEEIHDLVWDVVKNKLHENEVG